MLQRQQNFRWEKTDPIVAYYLDDADLNAIRHWQVQPGYTFEFHEQHETGNPIYIRRDGNNDNSLITKIDTKNIANPATHYANKKNPRQPWIETIANFNKIEKLPNTAITEIVSIMTNEWARIQKLTDRRWSGWRRPAPPKTLMERALESGQYPPPPLK